MRLLVLLALAQPVAAREIAVGPGGFATTAEAARAAQAGDTVRIAAGHYGCAAWLADRLTIQGAGMDATVIEGPLCRGKTLFLMGGRDIKVSDLTLRGARSAEGNAAGMWVDVPLLTVARVRFENNQNGILTGPLADGVVTVRESLFSGNGACIGACAHGIYAGHIRQLSLKACYFVGTVSGHHIKSRATFTTLEDVGLEDGPDGSPSYAVDVPDGGSLFLLRVRISKGVNASNPTAIAVGEESLANGAGDIALRDVSIDNHSRRPVAALMNRMGVVPRVTGLRTEGAVVLP